METWKIITNVVLSVIILALTVVVIIDYIKHIRRLLKAITGALYPVLSDHSGQSFFDISAAASEMIIV